MSISSKIRNVRNALNDLDNLTEAQRAVIVMAQGELSDAADWAEELEKKPLCDLGVAPGEARRNACERQ